MNRAQVLIILADTAVEEVPNIEELILGRNQLKIIDEGCQDLKLHEVSYRACGNYVRNFKSTTLG